MRYENHTFDGASFAFEGNEYVNCVFKSCRLTYAGGDFAIEGSAQFVDTNIQFLGAAKNAQTLLMHLQTSTIRQWGDGAYINTGGKWFKQCEKPDFAD